MFILAIIGYLGLIVARPSIVMGATPQSYGINAGDLLFSPTLNSDLADIKSMGITWVRTDVDWAYLQPNSRTFNWSIFDNFVNKANANGLKTVMILDYSAPWAYAPGCSRDAHCRPDTAKFAAYAKAVVQRYAPKGVHTYEVWNEPNLETFWKPKPNAAQYVTLLKATYTAIKQADPMATVVSAGLSPIATYEVSNNIPATTFTSAMYKAGVKGSFDAFGFHPYGYPTRPDDNEEWNGFTILDQLNPSIRSIMVKNGDSAKKIWLTEFGAPTGGEGAIATCSNYNYQNEPDHVDECLQSSILAQGINRIKSRDYVANLFLFDYRDLGTSGWNENFFGLVKNNGTRKASYEAVKQAIKL